VYAGADASPSVISRNMILWGNDGLALTDGVNLVVLSGSFFSGYRGAPTQ
jgi:hypothetical protein